MGALKLLGQLFAVPVVLLRDLPNRLQASHKCLKGLAHDYYYSYLLSHPTSRKTCCNLINATNWSKKVLVPRTPHLNASADIHKIADQKPRGPRRDRTGAGLN
jgi:hypothetical protein